jgi:hypothetical protein
MVVLSATIDAEVDYDLGEKEFAPGFRKVVGNVKRQPIAPLTQQRIILLEVTHPSICISHSRSDHVV